MKLRLAKIEEIEVVYSILEDAKHQIKLTGSTQWQSGEPSLSTLKKDVETSTCYVLEDEGNIIATVNISFEKDPNYSKVYEGAWQNEEDSYITLHRLAVRQGFQNKGYTRMIYDSVKSLALDKGIKQLRIDTHIKNDKMIHSVLSYGFVRIGIVEVKDPIDPKRVAFQYII